ncbi:unnamed protein product [Bursaphelenchus okinawaensis]|uniref:SCP domain-containing protein n=1 Tax=Bursaphelenchus okinawaensis TaxID=465554 RepID=A0A811K5V6_9BILA|nr:unnamed protein product [Bursaphelenchus okinawaensis]CAG9092074.1 unnamed protein product [Bursaphelenchus okinawaensis]
MLVTVIWANSYLVGCGVTQCPTITNMGSDFDNGFIIVCNYQTAINYITEPVDIAGDVCSQCPSDRVCDDGLCSLDLATSSATEVTDDFEATTQV